MIEDKVLEKQIDVLERLSKYGGVDRVMEFKDVVAELQAEQAENKKRIFNSNISGIDKLTEGFRPGQLNVFSGPTGNGKTAFLQFLTKQFSNQEIPCTWFSYEVPTLEFADRFGDDIPSFHIPRKLKESSLEWMKLRALESIAKYQTQVIFIDHLHYLLDMNMLSKAKSTSILIGMMMRELKKFAVNTNTTIFLVSHLTKTRLDAPPTIDDLRDSSFVGQESDLVMILWRHRIKDAESPNGYSFTNESRLVIDKNRHNGKLGYVKMLFDRGDFLELDTIHNEQS